MATKVRIFAGAVHYTDDAAHDHDLVARMNAGVPLPAGTISLGTGYNAADGTAISGLNINWSPGGLTATRWKPQLHAGNWGFPLAVPVALFLFPPLLYWIVTRPRKLGFCVACGYSRVGIDANAPCPECGRTSASQSADR